tara:strand:- start:411 stop:980 length:570 start_codon:yes stop_codon:yes gene_type:complete
MNHEEAENFARKCAVGIGICIVIMLTILITWDGTGEAPGDNPICWLAFVMIAILMMAGAMAGEKANMDTMSRIENNAKKYGTSMKKNRGKTDEGGTLMDMVDDFIAKDKGNPSSRHYAGNSKSSSIVSGNNFNFKKGDPIILCLGTLDNPCRKMRPASIRFGCPDRCGGNSFTEKTYVDAKWAKENGYR